MSALVLAERLASVRGDSEWARMLPALVTRLCARWGLTLEAPFQPGGFWAWVAPGRDGLGRPVVLKCSAPGRAPGERAALAAWAGEGATRLYAADGEDALLLERLLPGRSLRERCDGEQPGLAAAVCARLWLPAAALALPTLADLLAAWQTQLGWLPAVAAELCATSVAVQPRLLHGDLHEENLLGDGNGYRAIDPDPLVGDPAFELEPLLRRHLDGDDPAGARALLAACASLGADPARSLAWAAVRAEVYEAFCAAAGDRPRVETWQLRRARLQQLSGR